LKPYAGLLKWNATWVKLIILGIENYNVKQKLGLGHTNGNWTKATVL